MTDDASAPPAAGQTLRWPGVSRDAALHEQLYRYAQDMQSLLETHTELEQRYRILLESYDSVTQGRSVLEGLIHASREIYLLTDAKGTIVRCNPAAASIAPVTGLLGSSLADHVAPTHRDAFAEMIERIARTSAPRHEETELHFHSQDARDKILITSAYAMPARSNGALRAVHWMIRDVTRMREAEFESQISSRVFDSAVEGVMITDLAGDILAVNPAFTNITGYKSEEVIGRNPRILSSGRQDSAFYETMWGALKANGKWQGQIHNRKKNGEIYPQWLALSSVRDDQGKVLSYIAVFSDLSRLLQAEKRLFHLAQHDALTELPNRQLLLDRMQQLLALAKRRNEGFTVLFIDLDGFKQINDTRGHAAGDIALREIAARLRAAVRQVDTVARLGGDEFVVLAPGISDRRNVGAVAAKLIQSIAVPVSVGDGDVQLGASIGCALYPDHGEDDETLLRSADMAMYQAKRSGGNTHAIYSDRAE